MKIVKQIAFIDHEKCTGCGICCNVCPTEAIKLLNKKAMVSDEKCIACCNCWTMCPEYAIKLVLRPKQVVIGIDPIKVNQKEIEKLCRKAHLHPRQYLCLCTRVRAEEVAAAVIMGAKTPEEISLMTGIRSGCTLYCLAPALRLLKAHGIQLLPPKGYRWYDTTVTLWDIEKEIQNKYQGYYLEEDKGIIKEI